MRTGRATPRQTRSAASTSWFDSLISGNRVPFNPQGTSHFLYAWNTLMGFPEKTDPDVFRTISHLDIECLQDYRMSLINGSRRTLAGN